MLQFFDVLDILKKNEENNKTILALFNALKTKALLMLEFSFC